MQKSIRKFIRLEKSKIRQMSLDLKEKEKLISELYKKFAKKGDENTRNLQVGGK